MTIQAICDLIVVIGAAYFTIVKILDSFAKPTSKLKKRSIERSKERVKNILDEIMPNYFKKHDEESRDTYVESIATELQPSLDQIIDQNEEQTEQIIELQQEVKQLDESSKDILRQNIMSIYHLNKYSKSLTLNERESLNQLYKDYKARGGNSYIDKYYNEMKDWSTMPDF